MSANKKINIVPESVFNVLKGKGISQKKLTCLLDDVSFCTINYEHCHGKDRHSTNVLKLIAIIQYLWNENVVLNERLRALMSEQPTKKTIKKKSIHKWKFQCVKCGEWYPHSKVEVWDENPSVIRYICHRCQEEEGV